MRLKIELEAITGGTTFNHSTLEAEVDLCEFQASQRLNGETLSQNTKQNKTSKDLENIYDSLAVTFLKTLLLYHKVLGIVCQTIEDVTCTPTYSGA